MSRSPSEVSGRSEPPPTSRPHGDAIDTSLAATGTAFGSQLSGQPRACYRPLRPSLVPRRSCRGAEAALFWAGQKSKQVASVSNPLVKHLVELRLSAAYRHSCRCLLLVGLVSILALCRFDVCAFDYMLSTLDGVEVSEESNESALL
ncbi:hypothetical protein PR202_gb11378 [Eleusine coracana subsp. coracana]|uniref:Uncharacterized protein n=1 Tax=Eleusine coracana subsp. coracana TaxID=191504 RepID=A0AAV5EKF4_ELECO|nr:hypothetical protein PR202_gb11378 [Eleusine coracana subsp. coracana]